MNKKIVFFGTEAFSARFLKALIDAKFDVAAVVTKPDSRKGRGHEVHSPLIKQLAEQHHITVMQPTRLSDIIPQLQTLGPVVGVLVSYGKIVPQRVIECFEPGIINVHPSLLPKYRGPSPVETAIYHQDDETGVSIMKLSKMMDAGPVYSRLVVPLNGTETKNELYDKLGQVAEKELVTIMPAIIDGLEPIPQHDTDATYCHLLTKADGVLDPAHMNAAQADAHVRAYVGFPGSRLTLGNIEVIITKAHVSETATDLSVKCSDGRYLAIDQLKPLGKKEMPRKAFLAGYKHQL